MGGLGSLVDVVEENIKKRGEIIDSIIHNF
jgi:hypothetical protein